VINRSIWFLTYEMVYENSPRASALVGMTKAANRIAMMSCNLIRFFRRSLDPVIRMASFR
jgi:hypothetical protein